MSSAIALTAGDPSGVGPELLAALLYELRDHDGTTVVVSSEEELDAGIQRAGLPLTVDQLLAPAGITLHPHDGGWPQSIGEVSAQAGQWALTALDQALALHQRGQVDALVFGPLNKASLHHAGMGEPDEMRWFETRFAGDRTVSEVNVHSAFWTSRVTSHVALREVSAGVTAERVADATVLLHRLLVAAGNPNPRLAVCALNPHAGEGGLFGDEEITAITPGIALQAEGADARGPFPCDTLFRRGFDGEFDGIVTMYHDQGQIALKTRSFDGGVTLEAGLPLPICTPAHGTAFDIVGTGQASILSTLNAYRLASRLANGDG